MIWRSLSTTDVTENHFLGQIHDIDVDYAIRWCRFTKISISHFLYILEKLHSKRFHTLHWFQQYYITLFRYHIMNFIAYIWSHFIQISTWIYQLDFDGHQPWLRINYLMYINNLIALFLWILNIAQVTQ